MPTSVAYIGTGQIMGWGNKAIEVSFFSVVFQFQISIKSMPILTPFSVTDTLCRDRSFGWSIYA